MKKMIDNLDPGVPQLTRVLTEFLSVIRERILWNQEYGKRHNTKGSWCDIYKDKSNMWMPYLDNRKHPFNIESLDLAGLFYLWKENIKLINKETEISQLAFEYLHESKTRRNETHHYSLAKEHVTEDDYKNRGLDTARRLILMLIPYINEARGTNDFMDVPEFKYSIIQPDDSRVIGEYIPQTMKAKVVEDISLKKAYFDFGKARLKVTKNNLKHIFKDFNYLRDKESILVVRTYGDLFRYESDRTGYTGDWRVNDEVSKICVFHFYGGEQSESAHVYVADYVRKSEETNYREDSPRYRYYFKNIEYAGEINSVRTSEFDSWQIINMDDINKG